MERRSKFSEGMMNIISSIGTSFSTFKKDKWIALFSLVPVTIGALIYIFLGKYLFTDLLGMGKQWIESSVSSSGWSSVFYYLIVGLLSIAFYFLVNWTFILIVSLIASPFNDIISSRVEKVLVGKKPDDVSHSFKRLFGNLAETLLNEIKKIALIVVLTLTGFFVSFIPILAPAGILISALLMSVSFLDYSWSRKNMKTKECVSEVKKNFITYSIMGGAFLTVMSIPLFNIFVIPFGVVYFTTLHTKGSLNEIV
jgi:CysZ protein